MSKELAQTVGGKKLGLLLVLLAAIAVLATVGSHWQSAKATVTPASYTLSGPYDAITACNTVPAAGTALTSPQPYGTHGFYCVSVAADTTIANPVTIVVTAPSGSHINSITPTTGPLPTCSAPTAGNGNSVTCTYTGLTGTSTYGLGIDATLMATTVAGAGGAITAGAFNATADDPAAQTAAPFGANTTAAITVTAADLTLAKAQSTTTPAPGSNVTYTITVTDPAGANVINADGVHVLDTIDPNGFVSIQSVSTSQGSCTGVGPTFPDTTSPWTIDCSLGTVAVGGTATITIVGTVVTPPTTNPVTTVVVDNTATGTTTTGPDATSNTTVFTVSGALGAAAGVLCEGLYHVDPFGNLELGAADTTADCTTAAPRDVDNNVIGYNHMVCLVVATDSEFPLPDGIQPPNTASPTGSTRFRIDTVSGTSNVQGQALQIYSPPNAVAFGNGTDLDCVHWYSTAPGEQNVTVVDNSGQVVADWADGPTNGLDLSQSFSGICGSRLQVGDAQLILGCLAEDPISAYTPLVKEWNELLPTTITASAVSNTAALPTNLDQNVTSAANGNAGAILNPSSSTLVGASGTFYENVLVHHANATGDHVYLGIGANVTFTFNGTCGSFTLTDPSTFNNPTGTFVTNIGDGSITSSTSITVESVGVSIPFTFSTNGSGSSSTDCSGFTGSNTGVTIQAAYPEQHRLADPDRSGREDPDHLDQPDSRQAGSAGVGRPARASRTRLAAPAWRYCGWRRRRVLPVWSWHRYSLREIGRRPRQLRSVPVVARTTTTLAPDQIEAFLTGDNSQTNGLAGEGDAPSDSAGCLHQPGHLRVGRPGRS